MNNVLGQKKNRGAKLPLELEQYQAIRRLIRAEGRLWKARNLLLINLQVNSSLRASDLLSLKVGDIYRKGAFHRQIWVKQKKTGHLASVKLLGCMVEDLQAAKEEYEGRIDRNYFEHPRFPLFPSQMLLNPLSYSRYLGLLKAWFAGVGLDPALYGSHSLRSAVPVRFYSETGDGIATSKLFGHSKLSTTTVYLEEVAKMRAADFREEFHFYDS